MRQGRGGTPATAAERAPASARRLPGRAEGAAAATSFDLLLRNGQVIDGTGNAWFYGDVAHPRRPHRRRRHAQAGAYKADREIDAKRPRRSPPASSTCTPTPTTTCTSSRWPRTSSATASRRSSPATAAAACATSASTSRGIDKAASASTSRRSSATTPSSRAVKGDKAGELTPEQMDKAKEIVDQAMRDGAVGMSTGLIYTPGKWSKTEEIIELQKVAAKYGGIYATHMRNEGGGDPRRDRRGAAHRPRGELPRRDLALQAADRRQPSSIGGSDVTLEQGRSTRGRRGRKCGSTSTPTPRRAPASARCCPTGSWRRAATRRKKILSDPERVERAIEDDAAEPRGPARPQALRLRRDRRLPRVSASYVGKSIQEVAQIAKGRPPAAGAELLDAATHAAVARPRSRWRTSTARSSTSSSTAARRCVFHSMDETDVENILRNPLVVDRVRQRRARVRRRRAAPARLRHQRPRARAATSASGR